MASNVVFAVARCRRDGRANRQVGGMQAAPHLARHGRQNARPPFCLCRAAALAAAARGGADRRQALLFRRRWRHEELPESCGGRRHIRNQHGCSGRRGGQGKAVWAATADCCVQRLRTLWYMWYGNHSVILHVCAAVAPRAPGDLQYLAYRLCLWTACRVRHSTDQQRRSVTS